MPGKLQFYRTTVLKLQKPGIFLYFFVKNYKKSIAISKIIDYTVSKWSKMVAKWSKMERRRPK
jgi:hypothetical protein